MYLVYYDTAWFYFRQTCQSLPETNTHEYGQTESPSSTSEATKGLASKPTSTAHTAISTDAPTTAMPERQPAPEKTSMEAGSLQLGTAGTKPTTRAKAEATEASFEAPPREKEVRRTAARPTAVRTGLRLTFISASSSASATETGQSSKRA